ncbi:hydroxyisourate hydrolase [Phytohabitans sp. LJ34]|uniref:hydroxyisourate hydrolase n=1 Tax=Phytohabitans sp. LJ34 TaxID=3452217 RepID=UPI003F89CD67
MSLSTHVLDNATGQPARGVPVRLERRDGDGWTTVAAGRTDTDGRVRDWPVEIGVHRLVFDTAANSDFFPEVAVVFQVADADRHYHVPLLLSPYGYTTYRGS